MALAAILLFVLFVPAKQASAFFTYGMQASYQQNDATTGGESTSTAQERFSFYFNMNSNPFSRLTMAGILRLDVLEDKRVDGTTSTELQPNADFRFSTKAVQLGVGHREILRNENIINVNTTQTQRTTETDSYVESNLVAGRLPNLRVRYSIRNDTQNRAGFDLSDTNTNDFLVSMNYRLGIFLINADYRNEVGKNKVTGIDTTSTQANGQVSFSRRLGNRIDIGLRENYSLSETTGTSSDPAVNPAPAPTRQSSSTTEARGNFNLFKGASITSNYIYRIADDLVTGNTTERTWATTVNYNLPKFLRLYGSYVTREADSPGTVNSTTNTVVGASYNQSIGKFTFASRYEMRFDNNEVTGTGAAKTTNEQDNLDWALGVRPSRFLGLLLSESFVASTLNGVSTDTNHFRLRADIGPLKALTLGPYVEYTITSGSSGAGTTATSYVVPAAFHINLHQKLDFSVTDTYNLNLNTTENAPSTRSSTNNAVLRLTLSRPFPNTTIAGDASFTTSSTNTTPTTSTSTYTVRAAWNKNPHILNANFSYQTSSINPASMSFAGQYALNFRLKKLFMGFQARYDYSMVFQTPASSSQAIYVLLNLRK